MRKVDIRRSEMKWGFLKRNIFGDAFSRKRKQSFALEKDCSDYSYDRQLS